jgi:hypothetical protein
VIPFCRDNGCAVHKTPGSPERIRCEHACVLGVDKPDKPAVKKVKAKVVAKVKPPKIHLGSGGPKLTAKEIPRWKSRLSGTGPWEKTLCGNYTEFPETTLTQKVTCATCRSLVER